jgi:hypothetical protein
MSPLHPSNSTRRNFLALGTAAWGAFALSGCNATDGRAASKYDGYIDAHSHLWTSDTQRFPLGKWITPDKMDPASFTAEQLLAIAEPCGVDRAVIIQHAPYWR